MGFVRPAPNKARNVVIKKEREGERHLNGELFHSPYPFHFGAVLRLGCSDEDDLGSTAEALFVV